MSSESIDLSLNNKVDKEKEWISDVIKYIKGPVDHYESVPNGPSKRSNEVVGNIETIWEEKDEKVYNLSNPLANCKL